MKKSCPGSGDELDAQYRVWNYPEGLLPVKCRCCNAHRKPVVREVSVVWPRRRDITETRLYFPYHKPVQETAKRKAGDGNG